MRIPSITLLGLLSLGLSVVSHAGINVANGATITTSGQINATTIQSSNGSLLTGTGNYNAATTVNGVLNPNGNGIGVLQVSDLTVGATGLVDFQIDAAGVAGTDFDQIQVTGSVTFQTGAGLSFSGAGALNLGDSIVLIANDGADPVSGTFGGLPEGTLLPLPTTNTLAKISYSGGDGNDVVLSVVDTDGDGVDNVYELAGKDSNGYFTGHGPTNPSSNDTDGDGTFDGAELSVLRPVSSYAYNVNPHASYPDTGGSELNNGDVGDLVWGNIPNHLALSGWFNANPDVTFTFPAAQAVDSVTAWAADSDGSAGVGLPSELTIYADGVLQGSYPVSNPAQTGNVVPLTVSGLGLSNVSSIRLVATRASQWTMFSEVQFSGKAPVQTNASIGTITKSGLTLADDDRVILRIDGSSEAGVNYDQVQVTGTVDLGTAALQLFGTLSGANNFDEIVLIDNDGVDPVVGRFGGFLAEGAQVTLPSGGDPLYISYVGGDGNDVTLRYQDPDNDSLANDVDTDDDGDGISDVNELAGNDAAGVSTGFGATNPLHNDTDRDGISDTNELAGNDASGTTSGYGASNPTLADSDADGISDPNELAGNNASGTSSGFGSTNPNNSHSDSDGIADGYELAGQDAAGATTSFGVTNPNSDDSDSDGISDNNELAGNDAGGSSTSYGATNPALADSDADLVADLVELKLGFDPNDNTASPIISGMTVSTLVDEDDDDYSAGDFSLREAVGILAATGVFRQEAKITFDPSLDGGSIEILSQLSWLATRPELDLTGLSSGIKIHSDSHMLFGTQGLAKIGEAKLTLALNYTSGHVYHRGGVLQIGDGGTRGYVSGIIYNDDRLIYNHSGAVTSAGLYGTGSLQVTGGGTLNLLQDHPMSGGVTVDSGSTLSMSPGGFGVPSGGSIASNIVNNGTVRFNRVTTSFSNVISGSGNVEISAPLTFTQNQTYTGKTTIIGGNYRGNVQLATSEMVINGGTTFIPSAAISPISYPISGAGILQLSNTDMIEITMANPNFTGAVNGGFAQSNLVLSNTSGSALGSADILFTFGGCKLEGNGSMTGDVTLAAFFPSDLMPGKAAVGTLTLGNTTLGEATYHCEIDGVNADKVVITGALNLGANVTLDFSELSGGATELAYVIAKYTTLTGTFTTVTDLPAGYTVDYAYNDGVDSNNIAITRSATAAENWALANGLTIGAAGNGLLSIDTNGDGKTNAYHFAFNTDPMGDGSSEGKQHPEVTTAGGSSEHLTLTIPVRNAAVFSGAGASPTLTVDGIIYTVRGDENLQGTNALPIAEHTPALSAGLPALDSGYSYRTFYLQDDKATKAKGFITVEVSEQ